MKICLFLILALVTSFASAQSQKTRIAFGSCSREDASAQLWNEIIAADPDLWIWAGDNVYGDTRDMKLLKQKYEKQKSNPDYQNLIKKCPVTGTWDDHDYGENDSGKYFPQKKESKQLLLEFLNVKKKDPVWKHEGVYSSRTFGSKPRKVKVINLDTRYFRDSLQREYFYTDTISKKRDHRYKPNLTGDILGEQQWKWLEQELKNSDAQINIINSSIQVISEEHRFEKWANFPAVRKRLFDLIAAYPSKRVIIISGDRHIAEISKLQLPGLSYPLIDFTSSGLTHTWSKVWEESNKYREGKLIAQKNFGVIEIDWSGPSPAVKFQVRGEHGNVYLEKEVLY